MSRVRGGAFLLLWSLLPSWPAKAEASTGEPPPPEAHLGWKDGVEYRLSHPVSWPGSAGLGLREEVALRGRIGAKLWVDAAGFASQDDIITESFDVGIRRARLYAAGELVLLGRVEYKLEFGIANQEFFFNDGYLRIPDVPWLGRIQLGLQDAPFGLDALMSGSARPFMEQALPDLALAPGTKAGLVLGGPQLEDRLTWALGFFTNSGEQDTGSDTDQLLSGALRITGLPWLDETPGADGWLHLGLALGHVIADPSGTRYRARPESYLANYVVDTGALPTRQASLIGFELAAARGPLALQAEFLGSFASPADFENLYFGGFYGQVAWTLTGESHPYARKAGLPTRLTPRIPFSLLEGGRGAFEVALRFAHVSLTSGATEGGNLSQLGGVLNWYWNEHVRIQLDASIGQRSAGPPTGLLGVVQTRVQIDY